MRSQRFFSFVSASANVPSSSGEGAGSMTPEIDCGTVDTNTTPEPSKLELAQQAMRLRQEELHERAKAKAQGKRVNVVRDLSSMVGKVMAQLETPTRETLRQELTPALIAATQHLELTILSDESTASQKSKAVDQVFTLLKALSKAEARHMELLARVADSKAARAN